jgi:hypothetical protein
MKFLHPFLFRILFGHFPLLATQYNDRKTHIYMWALAPWLALRDCDGIPPETNPLACFYTLNLAGIQWTHVLGCCEKKKREGNEFNSSKAVKRPRDTSDVLSETNSE